jgi:hypothetical protein
VNWTWIGFIDVECRSIEEEAKWNFPLCIMGAAGSAIYIFFGMQDIIYILQGINNI